MTVKLKMNKFINLILICNVLYYLLEIRSVVLRQVKIIQTFKSAWPAITSRSEMFVWTLIPMEITEAQDDQAQVAAFSYQKKIIINRNEHHNIIRAGGVTRVHGI